VSTRGNVVSPRKSAVREQFAAFIREENRVGEAERPQWSSLTGEQEKEPFEILNIVEPQTCACGSAEHCQF